MSKGRSIRLFLADGTPGGIITAEIMNWTGHVLVGPRSRLADLLKRVEEGQTGVYFLAGPDPDGGIKPIVYIGESDQVATRLAQHNVDPRRAYWQTTCVVTNKDKNVTKAHVLYLESRLIALAKGAARAKLDNVKSGEYGSLSEADKSDMDYFIEQLRIILPVLGLDFLKDQPTALTAAVGVEESLSSTVTGPPAFTLYFKKEDLRAEAREVDGEFIVLAGSQGRADWIGAPGASYANLRQQLVDGGILVADGSGHRRFEQDYAFKSPSAASAVILGRHDNGRMTWRVKHTDKTYAAWQEEQVATITPLGKEE